MNSNLQPNVPLISASPVTFTSFHDLLKSPLFEDQTNHDIFIRLLDAFFGKHDDIMINTECENEKNQQLIKDQWNIILKF